MKNVSRETLRVYVELLLKWQKKINLISGNTESDIWKRHIDDSVQLGKLIPDTTKTVIDIGSGAGLPGIPISIVTGVETYLIESDIRKSVFLQEAIRQLKLDAFVINKRIEIVKENFAEPVVITARALADLNEIFNLTYALLQNNNIGDYKIILLKGKNVSRETLEAETKWEFEREYIKSETNPEASIMIVTKLKPR